MLVGRIREELATYSDNENVLCYLVTKEEVNETMIHLYGDDYSPVSEDEYITLVEDFVDSNDVAEILDNQMSWSVSQIVEVRKTK